MVFSRIIFKLHDDELTRSNTDICVVIPRVGEYINIGDGMIYKVSEVEHVYKSNLIGLLQLNDIIIHLTRFGSADGL